MGKPNRAPVAVELDGLNPTAALPQRIRVAQIVPAPEVALDPPRSPPAPAKKVDHHWYDDSWKLLGCGLILLGFGIAFLLFVFLQELPAIAIGGIVILVFSVLGLNVLSDDEDLSTGEIQKAITFAVLYVFFGLLAFGDQIPTDATSGVVRTALENFWIVALSVVGFYFGGRIVDQIRAPIKTPVTGLVDDLAWDLQKDLRAGDATNLDVGEKRERLERLVKLEQALAKK